MHSEWENMINDSWITQNVPWQHHIIKIRSLIAHKCHIRKGWADKNLITPYTY